jgi:hypothetical protein
MWPSPGGRRLGLALSRWWSGLRRPGRGRAAARTGLPIGPLGRRHCHPRTERLPPRTSSLARAMVLSVGAAMNSTPLRSTASAAGWRAMVRDSFSRSAPSVETSCSPASQTTMGSGSDPRGGREGTVQKKDPAWAIELSYLRRCEMSRYQGPEYRPQPVRAGPTRRGFLVSS